MSAEYDDASAPPVNHVEDEPQVAAELGIKIFAGNLPFTTDEASLRALFAPVENDIISTVVIQHFGRPKGYGFVTVNTQEAADKAVNELDKKEVDGRAMVVEVARTKEAKDAARKHRRRPYWLSRRGYRPALGEVTEAEANGQLVPAARIDDAGATGEAQETGETAPKPKKKKSKKRKPRTAATGQGAAPNGEVNGVEGVTDQPAAIIDGATPAGGAPAGARRPRRPREPREPGEVRVRRPYRPRRERGQEPVGEPSKSVLFIANLAFSVDEEMLTEFFTNAGITVKSARVVRGFPSSRHWGAPRRSRGYGFVDVGDEAEQQKAIELTNGKMVADREIIVKVAVDAKRSNEVAETAEETENPDDLGNATLPAVPVTN